jgi:TRAP-type C4-dicarboxylate transport system permease small subunit
MNSQSPGSRLASFENAVSVAVMGAMVALPLTEFLGGLTIGRGIVTGSGPLVQHLMLWVAFLGAALAARSDSLLALSTPDLLPAGWRAPIRIFASAVGAGITVWLLISSVTLVRAFSTFDDRLALGIPRWIAFLALPAGFALIAARLILNASENRAGRFAAAGGLAFPLLFLLALTPGDSPWVAPALLVILAATVLGMPVYAALGGAALVLFWQDLSPLVEVSYDILDVTNSPQLPAIPLFTVAGYLLAEGGAGRRLLAMFSAWLGWMPGGLAIAVTLILALFTPLTGASGVTILSLGGLLLPMMARAGYPRDTSLGLVTVSGSIGLLLPPSLPVILYAVHGTGEGRVVRIDHLFIGALVPGLLLILVVAAWAAFRGWKTEVPRTAFEPARAVRSII